jgi:N-formylglutamate deformylase
MPRSARIERCACPSIWRDLDKEGVDERHWKPRLCATCGEPVRVQRWSLSSVEGWGHSFQEAGFIAVAPGGIPPDHPGIPYVRAAVQELHALVRRCEACFGYGVSGDETSGWQHCHYCLGTGRLPVVPVETLQAAHRERFGAWPQHYRHSLLYGITGSVPSGEYPRYDGPTVPYEGHPSNLVAYGPLPGAGAHSDQRWVLAPERHARRRARTLQAIALATTWGEARRGVHPRDRHLLDDAEEGGSAAPIPDDAPFGVHVFGDRPPAPDDGVDDWFPAPEGARAPHDSPPRDATPTTCATHELPSVIAHLERHGFRVVRDDELITSLYGAGDAIHRTAREAHLPPEPAWPAWLVFHAPHASTVIPAHERHELLLDDADLEVEIARLTDHAVVQAFVPYDLQPDSIAAPVSRLVVDVERFLDNDTEPMAARGMGAIYTRTSDGRPLREPPSRWRRIELLERYYLPHHQRLTAAVDAALAAHGRALILDIHSFPDTPLPCDLDQTSTRPDVCIGTDAFHTPPGLAHALRHAFEERGFSVAIDRPYSGTMVPTRHLRRDTRVASVMIEVNRRLYLDGDGTTWANRSWAVGQTVQACMRRGVVAWGGEGGGAKALES